MIDPIPQQFTPLGDVVLRLAAQISDAQLGSTKNLPYSSTNLEAFTSSSVREWNRRELAIRKLYAALQQGEVVTLIREPMTAEMFRVRGDDWRRCAFWREMIIGGQVRASVGEDIARHEGRTLLIETSALERWLAQERERKSLALDTDCQTWLETAMRGSPDSNPHAKAQWCLKAQKQFGVSARTFERLWASAIANTGAKWNRPGRPKKNAELARGK